jgi:hypothetical protein
MGGSKEGSDRPELAAIAAELVRRPTAAGRSPPRYRGFKQIYIS